MVFILFSIENAKLRSDSVGSDSQQSAPSSFIQQPDSYYGSYIEDSFVGDFVGDYMDPENDHQDNILVMDPDGKNLMMLNPNETISRTHEIEFEFDSFGPESIIYAGNVETITSQTNTVDEKNGEDDIKPDSNGHEDVDKSSKQEPNVDVDVTNQNICNVSDAKFSSSNYMLYFLNLNRSHCYTFM